METEKAMHAALLLGRFASTLRDQIVIVSHITASDISDNFETGWSCALQEDSLRRALSSLNFFLQSEGEELLGPVLFKGGSLKEWEEVLRQRLQETEDLCQKMREESLSGTVLAEDIFPELEEGS